MIFEIITLIRKYSLTGCYNADWDIHDPAPEISHVSGLTNLTYLYLYENQISDIQPIVDNAGITGNSDYVYLDNNLLDSDDCGDIQALIDIPRQVNVYHDVICE